MPYSKTKNSDIGTHCAHKFRERERLKQNTAGEIAKNFTTRKLDSAEQNIRSALQTAQQSYKDMEKYKSSEFLYDRGMESIRNQYDTVIKLSETILKALQ